ncbi:hypothetical protein [Streptomyces coffeae]|uniref:Ricin B lectin domain-containing protein n=1 Tax=Streptomyces coffeae TaxID=621382 RepID=A0ABS1NR05_9ACTN|nr:hypothetical protein [Streptomyces coffeae]MBL1102533.1 hypothetical protein [Streptomyces coffeae]
MITDLLKRSPGIRTSAGLATVTTAFGLVAFPPVTTAAHAETNDTTVTISAAYTHNGSSQTLYVGRYTKNVSTGEIAYGMFPAADLTVDSQIPQVQTDQQFRLVQSVDGDGTSDGTFKLENGTSKNCLTLDPGTSRLAESTCGTDSPTWNFQPTSTDSADYLIRQVGTNKCITRLDGGIGVSDCSTDQDKNERWSISANGAPLPALSNRAAVALGSNKITVCNWGGYAARATIDYKVKADPDSDTETSGRSVIGSFPVRQCREVTLPAGKITATVVLRRFTNYYMGNYGFQDGGSGFAGDANDKITAVYTVGGAHVDGSFHMYGTSCDSSSKFEQASASQAVASQQQGQVGCTSDVNVTTVAGVAATAFEVARNFIFSSIFK